jgi:outer membrane protein TolC
MNIKLLFFSVLIGLFLSGCTVKTITLKQKEIQNRIERDLEKMFEKQEPITEFLTLWDAIARALKYNLEHRAQLMEIALNERLLNVANYSMLPDLVFAAGYSERNNDSGGIHQSLLTGKESLEASTTEPRDYFTSSFNMVLNVLDFGVSQAIAEQQANKVMIERERRRSVIQKIVKEVQEAYWYAVTAQRLLPQFKVMLREIQSQLTRYKVLEPEMLENPRIALSSQKRLLETARQLLKLSEKLSLAKIRLAKLINLPPGTSYEVAIPADYELPPLEKSIEELEYQALLNQPALRKADYLKRISQLEIKKSILRMFPGLEISLGTNYSSNQFLYNKSWINAGLQVSWNLLNVFTGRSVKKAAEAQVVLADHRRLALSMAILTQVRLSYQRYQLSLQEYKLTDELYIVNDKLARLAEAKNQGSDNLEGLFVRADTFQSQVAKDLAYVKVQNAMAKLRYLVGLDPLPKTLTTHQVFNLFQKYTPAPKTMTVVDDIPSLSKEIEIYMQGFGVQKRRYAQH